MTRHYRINCGGDECDWLHNPSAFISGENRPRTYCT